MARGGCDPCYARTMIRLLATLALAGPFDPPPAPERPEVWEQAWQAAPDPAFAPANPDPVVESALARALSLAGLPWTWGGRGTDSHPGIDCLGLVFRGYGDATGTAWRRYPVDPSKLVASGLLGGPVEGLAGVLRGEVDRSLLRRGDVVYFLQRGYEIPDAPLLERDGARYWPWHVGIYAGEGRDLVLNAHPTYDVVRMPLDQITWDAIFVTRPR